MKLELKKTSWENLFECIRHKETSIKTEGNFWVAIQRLEVQLKEQLELENQVNANSIENLELDKRVKKLEEKS